MVSQQARQLTPRRGTVAHLGNWVVVFTFTRGIYRFASVSHLVSLVSEALALSLSLFEHAVEPVPLPL